MPALGFIVFILPALAGMLAGVLLCCVPRLRFLAAYAILVPLFSSFAAFRGDVAAILWSRKHWTVGYLSAHPNSMVVTEVFGFCAGAALGLGAAVALGYGINRFLRLQPSLN